jgi:hypothetical protein
MGLVSGMGRSRTGYRSDVDFYIDLLRTFDGFWLLVGCTDALSISEGAGISTCSPWLMAFGLRLRIMGYG